MTDKSDDIVKKFRNMLASKESKDRYDIASIASKDAEAAAKALGNNVHLALRRLKLAIFYSIPVRTPVSDAMENAGLTIKDINLLREAASGNTPEAYAIDAVLDIMKNRILAFEQAAAEKKSPADEPGPSA